MNSWTMTEKPDTGVGIEMLSGSVRVLALEVGARAWIYNGPKRTISGTAFWHWQPTTVSFLHCQRAAVLGWCSAADYREFSRIAWRWFAPQTCKFRSPLPCHASAPRASANTVTDKLQRAFLVALACHDWLCPRPIFCL